MSQRQRGTTAWKNNPDSFYRRLATKEEVLEWAASDCGIAGITGEQSGIVALEVDCPETVLPLLAGLPSFRRLKTPTATSPSGGYHFLFRYAPGLKNLKVKNSILHSESCSCGRRELASFRAEGQLIVLPPGPGRKWRSVYSLDKGEVAEVPERLIDFLEDLSSGRSNDFSIEQPIEHPCSIEQSSNQEKGGTTLLEGNKDKWTALLEDDSPIIKLAREEDSPLIPALVTYLGGKGLAVPCPYHPPDDKASANFWYRKDSSPNKCGWYLVDHHCSPGEPGYSLPVSQLCADLETGYIDRCRSGCSSYQHRVYTFKKMKPEAWFWIALVASSLGLVQLPPSRFPVKLDGFTPEGERLMQFIDRWDRARRCASCNQPIPLGRAWLIEVLFAFPNPGKEKPKPADWQAAYNEHDKALYRAQRLWILEKVANGDSRNAARYHVLTPEERQAKQEGDKDIEEG